MHHQRPPSSFTHSHHRAHNGMNGWSAWSAGGGVSLSDPRVASEYGWSSDERDLFLDYPPRSPFTSSLTKLKRLIRQYWPLSSLNLNLPSISTRRHSRSLSSSSKFSLATTPAASTVRFVLLCSLWYATSALSSNTGKAIMIQFRYPITLTIVQFGFVALYCLLFMSPVIRFTRLRMPSRAIVTKTLPMGMFQVGGHMFSSMAISRIPVSTVHTIKVCLRSDDAHSWNTECLVRRSRRYLQWRRTLFYMA
jgi:hypothetical protein